MEKRVSIPSSSGHQFTVNQRSIFILNILLGVSIPSSSGHQFTEDDLVRLSIIRLVEFQSLLHQGISLLGAIHVSILAPSGAFQSLLHQGISLLESKALNSGLQDSEFQSLLHQGISLLLQLIRQDRSEGGRVSIPSSSGHQFTDG